MSESLKNTLSALLMAALGANAAYPLGWRAGGSGTAAKAQASWAERQALLQDALKSKEQAETGQAVVVAQEYVRTNTVRPDTLTLGKWVAQPAVRVYLEYSARASDGIAVAETRDFFVCNGRLVAMNPPPRAR